MASASSVELSALSTFPLKDAIEQSNQMHPETRLIFTFCSRDFSEKPLEILKEICSYIKMHPVPAYYGKYFFIITDLRFEKLSPDYASRTIAYVFNRLIDQIASQDNGDVFLASLL